MKNISFALISAFFLSLSLPAFSAGAETDIPFTLHGYLTIRHSATSLTATCKIVMVGRTNAKDSSPEITRAHLSGERLCDGTGGILYPWRVRLEGPANGNPGRVSIEKAFFSSAMGDCSFGEITGTRTGLALDGITPDDISIDNQKMGLCTLNGTLEIVSYPYISLSP